MNSIEAAQSYEQWLALPGEWVEPPNKRRGGMSGVQRVCLEGRPLLYRKQQAGRTYLSVRHPFGYPTVMRELEALQDCQRLGVAVPSVVYAGCLKQQGVWQGLLLTEALEGFKSLDECYVSGESLSWSDALHKQIVRESGRMLGRLNAGRRQHGCVYLKHVFVRIRGEQADVALIDLEKSRKRITRKQAACHDLRQCYRRLGWRGELWHAFLCGYQESFGAIDPATMHIPHE